MFYVFFRFVLLYTVMAISGQTVAQIAHPVHLSLCATMVGKQPIALNCGLIASTFAGHDCMQYPHPLQRSF
jgi:hypothetical protein